MNGIEKMRDNIWTIKNLGPEFTTVIHDRTGDLKVVDNNEISEYNTFQEYNSPQIYGYPQQQYDSNYPIHMMQPNIPDFQMPMIKPYEEKETPSVVVVVGDKNELHGLSNNTSQDTDSVKIIKKEEIADSQEKKTAVNETKTEKKTGGDSQSTWSSLTDLATGFFVKKV